MSSELRHPVYVWRDACIAYGGLSIEGTDAEYKAAAVIEAYGDEREAKGREEQAAELAKFKALAETLAGYAEHKGGCRRGLWPEISPTLPCDCGLSEALLQYKEATQ